jgi:hypothetical protein
VKQTSALTEAEVVAVVRRQWPDLTERMWKCTKGMHQVLEARGLDPDDAYRIADLAHLRDLFVRRTILSVCEAGGDPSVDARAQFVAWVEEEWDAWGEEFPAEPAKT